MSKPPHKSSAIWGIVTSFASSVGLALSLGTPLPLTEQARGAIQALAAAGLLGGSGVALRGRTVAKEPIAWPWSQAEPTDVTDELAAALTAAIRQTANSGQLPRLDDIMQYASNRIHAGPLPTGEAIAPDVPPSLLEDLARAEAAPSPAAAIAQDPPPRRGKYEFVAQQETKLRLSLNGETFSPVAEGESVWADAYRLADNRKYLEVRQPDGETFYLFTEHFKLKNEVGVYELMVLPEPVHPWVD